MTAKENAIKEITIKWLYWHINEINNNALSQEISTEDIGLNAKILKEISDCIEWVKSK